MPRPVLAAAMLVALAGCDTAATRATMETLTWNDVTAPVARASEDALREIPFTRGEIVVVAPERDEMRSYHLYPCQSGTGVCLNSPQGPASAVERTNAHYIVQFGNSRTFFLRPGGGGTMRTPAGDVPLAWNAMVNGVPAYPAPIWPYTPWFTQVPPGPNP